MSSINKKIVIEKFMKEGKSSCVQWLLSNAPENCKRISVEQALNKVVLEFRNVNKSKSRPSYPILIENFHKEHFKFPKPIPFKAKPSVQEKEISMVQDMEIAKNVIHGLAKDLKQSNKMNMEMETENQNLKTALSKRQSHKTRMKKHIEKKQIYMKQVKHLKYVIKNKNNLLKKLRSSRSYIFQSKQSIQKSADGLKIEVQTLKEEISTLKSELQSMKIENRNLELRNCYLEKDSASDVVLFDDDKKTFTPNTQECIYNLLSFNVTSSNISSVIQRVLNLVGLKANRLPCISTVNNMNVQRLILSQKQLAEVLPNESNLCLLSDETSKFGKKIEGYHVATEKGQIFVLGTRQIISKSGQDIFSVLQTILSDIDSVSKCTDNIKSKQILLNIVSTMSDRAATQIKFNALLKDYRKDILMKEMGENWNTLSLSEQTSLSSLNNFFCALHALVHIASSASTSLKVIEDGIFENAVPIYDPSFKKLGESGTVRLLRTVSKAFSCGGDEKCGVYGSFNVYVKDFLKSKKLHCNPIKRYHGNRFNILFESASAVFLMIDKIKNYVEVENSNRLLKSIDHDIHVPEFLAGVKALGLISCFITGPLWSYIERKDIHILDSCEYYSSLLTYLHKCIEDLPSFIEGKFLLPNVCEETLLADPFYQCLIEPWTHDSKVIIILESVLPAIIETLKHLFVDFLHGKWNKASGKLKEKTKSVPTHNKFSESVFGHIDRLLREKPNISTISEEAYIMFIHNKTRDWLSEMDCKKKSDMLLEARKGVKASRNLFKERRAEIERKRKELLEEKFREMELREQNRLQKLQKLTDNIIEWGLWQSETQVDGQMKLYKTKKDRIAALKAQLNFRKDVLHQCPKNETLKDVYRVTKTVDGKRVPINEDDLVQNVKSLIRHALAAPVQDDSTIQLTGHDISMKFETENGSQWYKGYVISKVPGYPKWFNVKFDCDEAIYTYQLMQDYQDGDLKILV